MDSELRWKLVAWVCAVGMLTLFGVAVWHANQAIPQPVGCKGFAGPLTPPPPSKSQSATGSGIPEAGQAVTPAASASLPDTVLLADRNPRIGFGLSSSANVAEWAGRLGATWYLSWSVTAKPLSTPEHWQMVRLAPGCTYPSLLVIRQIAHHYPGQVWILGNEPDVIWQDNLTPEQYTEHYHDLYQAIKSADPTARIATAGVSLATPLRLAYLDRVLQAYHDKYGVRMPVDIWTVHGFVLREEAGSWGVSIPPGMDGMKGQLYEIEDHGRVDLFQKQLQAFREWMSVHGYRDCPLVLTEFGILMPAEYGFSPETVSAYLQETFNWLANARDAQVGFPQDGNHLVQRWAWFSLSDPIYPNPDLADLSSNALTPIGEAFRDFVAVK